jgi:hypothetical protein
MTRDVPPLNGFFSPMSQQPLVGQGLLIIEASRSQSYTPHSVDSSGRVISPTQRPLPDDTQNSLETDIHAPRGFEPTIPASERPQTHALDRAATGIDTRRWLLNVKSV